MCAYTACVSAEHYELGPNAGYTGNKAQVHLASTSVPAAHLLNSVILLYFIFHVQHCYYVIFHISCSTLLFCYISYFMLSTVILLYFIFHAQHCYSVIFHISCSALLFCYISYLMLNTVILLCFIFHAQYCYSAIFHAQHCYSVIFHISCSTLLFCYISLIECFVLSCNQCKRHLRWLPSHKACFRCDHHIILC